MDEKIQRDEAIQAAVMLEVAKVLPPSVLDQVQIVPVVRRGQIDRITVRVYNEISPTEGEGGPPKA